MIAGAQSELSREKATKQQFRQGKPLEHTARSPSPALAQQLNVVVVTWDARAGLGQEIAANSLFRTHDGLLGPYRGTRPSFRVADDSPRTNSCSPDCLTG